MRAVETLLLVLFCCVPQRLQAQVRWVRVLNGASRPIASAALFLDSGATPRAVDSAGLVGVARSELMGTLRIRALGYRSVMLSGDSLGRTVQPTDTIVVVLDELAPLLGAVQTTSERPVLGGARVTRDVARRLPPLGEPDILRVLPLIGGVGQPNDIRPRLYLAGAAGDEVLVTLDGHPMQHGLHFDGLLGAFNLAALDRADVVTHAVPSSARSRVGGAIALEPRSVDAETHGDVGVSLAAANATVATAAGAMRLLASARTTWNGALLERVLNGAPTPGFRDGLVRLSTSPGGHLEADLIAFVAHNSPPTLVGGERSGLETTEALAGASLSGGLFGGRWTARSSQSRFRTQQVLRDAATGAPEARQLWTAASLDARWGGGRRWIGAHASFDARDHQHRWNRLRDDNPLLPAVFEQRAEQRLLHAAVSAGTAVGLWEVDAGARVSRSELGVWSAPQLNLHWRPRRELSVAATVGRRWQFDSQYGEPAAGGDPPPVFLLTTPRRMDGTALSIAWNGGARPVPRDVRIEATAFGRRFVDRTVPPPSTTPFAAAGSGLDGLEFVRTTGRAYGVSTTVSARGESGRSVQMAYTWQRAWQRDSTQDARAAWDIPHTLSALLSTPLGRRFELSSVVTWRSGAAVTPIAGSVLLPGGANASFRPRSGARNAARLPDYARVDAMLRWRGRVAATDVAATFQLINAFGRENVIGYRLDAVGVRPGGGVLPPPETGVPFLPSFGLEIRW